MTSALLQAEQRGALEGVVISVSKKLAANQTEYNSLVVELGGDYTWQYSPTCTHFVFQVRCCFVEKNTLWQLLQKMLS